MSAWLFYALIAPVVFSLANVLEKLLLDRKFSPFSFAVFSGLSYLLFFAILPFSGVSAMAITPAILLAAFVTGSAFFFNGFPYFMALSLEEASRVIPLWALEAPITLMLAFTFLGERLALTDYVGFVFVVLGAFLVPTRNLAEVLRPRKALLLMFVASAITGVGIVVSKWIYSQIGFWAAQSLIFGSGGSAALAFLLVTGRVRKFAAEVLSLRKRVALILGVRQLMVFSGFVLFGLAVMRGSASLSAALVQLTALFVFAWATAISIFRPRILKEEIDGKALLTKAVAIVMIIAGVFAINL